MSVVISKWVYGCRTQACGQNPSMRVGSNRMDVEKPDPFPGSNMMTVLSKLCKVWGEMVSVLPGVPVPEVWRVHFPDCRSGSTAQGWMLRNTVYLWVQQRKHKKHVDFWVRVQGLRVGVEIIRVVGKVIRVGELQFQNKLELFVTSSRQIRKSMTNSHQVHKLFDKGDRQGTRKVVGNKLFERGARVQVERFDCSSWRTSFGGQVLKGWKWFTEVDGSWKKSTGVEGRWQELKTVDKSREQLKKVENSLQELKKVEDS